MHTVTASHPARRRHVPVNAAAVLGGLVVLASAAVVASSGTVREPELSVFHAVNELPSWLYQPLWVFQQFGNLVVAFVVVLAIAVVLRSPKLAAFAVVAVVGKLTFERAVKSVVERRRPGTSVGDVVLRGDVSTGGLSFVSGHAVITAAMATILTPVLHGRWRYLPWVVVAGNGFARVYVGAHNPLDIVGGIALGVAIGAAILLIAELASNMVAKLRT
jgi:glycosyltransferase 2 family protein